MSHFIRAATLSGFDCLARQYGINPVETLRDSGILVSQLRNPDALISYEACVNVLEAAADKCQAPTFGLQLASLQSIETLGLIGAYMSKQPTVKDAFLVAQKYVYVHSDAFEFKVEIINEQCCELSLHRFDKEIGQCPQKAMLGIGFLYRLMTKLVGGEWHAQSVHFCSQINNQLHAEYQQFFNCPIVFNEKKDGLRFHPKFLSKAPCQDTSLIDKMIIEHFERNHNKPFDLLEQTRTAIKSLLSTGDCNKNNVALSLNIHTKKLQRELKVRRTTFREELEDIRKSEAVRMLKETNMPLISIALNLGYAEYAIFSRRFKHWYGASPSHYRKYSVD